MHLHRERWLRAAAHLRLALLPPPFLTALAFTAALALWEALVFGIDYGDFFTQATRGGYELWSPQQIGVLLLTMLASFVVALGFFWASLRSAGWLRAAAFAIFALAALYEYGYYKALGRFSAPEDALMAILYNDPTLYSDAVLTYLNLLALPPIALYGAVLLPRPRSQLRSSALLLPLCAAVLLYSLSFRVWYVVQSPFPTVSLSAFLRTATYTPWKAAYSYNGPRDPVAALGGLPPTNNIVFIVDESIRDDHLSLNGYPRATTPYLEELMRRGLLYNWGEAAAAATCSLSTNNLLLTGFHELPDRQNQIRRWPSIFQYARAAGYRTSYLDASNPMFWNGTGDDLRYIDRWENAEQFLRGPAYDADANLAARLRELLRGSTGNFIWVNKRGVHFFYNNTFPADQAHWTPTLAAPTHDPARRAELVNSYDNGLRYNQEGFFHTLLDDTSLLSNTLILYTADHGQTLAEHGEAWSHCRGERSEARVPLFLLAEPGLPIDTGYAASHANLFATLLDLLGVPADRHAHAYQPSLLRTRAADSQPRYYYIGGLDGSAGGAFRPFDTDGPRGLSGQAAGAEGVGP